MTVPQAAEDLDGDWLAAAFGLRPSALAGFAVEPIGAGRGLSGSLHRVHLRWAGATALPGSAVVKLAPGDRELRFYREIGAGSGLAVPGIYFSDNDAEAGTSVVLMEDLAGCELYELGNAPASAIAAMARAAGRMHALWWEDPRLATTSWFNGPHIRTRTFPAILRAALDHPHPWFSEHLPDRLRALAGQLPRAIEGGLYLNAGPRTFVHGDLGPRNVAIRPTGEVVVFDWQLCGTDTPGWDLAQLVSDSQGAVPAAEAIDLALGAHYEALSAAGVRDYSRAQLDRAFAIASLRGLTTPLGILRPGVEDPDREAICARWLGLFVVMVKRFDYERLFAGYA
ncbi:MAG: aminoglycoside phosphotransferase family protein [Dehalococcoidia bacterium]